MTTAVVRTGAASLAARRRYATSTVTFAVKGHNRHNVIWVGDTFKASPLLDPSESVKDTFDDTGDYAYYCSLHGTPTSRMTGGIRVVG